jgi:hypothetical protein
MAMLGLTTAALPLPTALSSIHCLQHVSVTPKIDRHIDNVQLQQLLNVVTLGCKFLHCIPRPNNGMCFFAGLQQTKQ